MSTSKKKEVGPLPYIKINSVNKRPKHRAKTIKLLEENTGGNLQDVGFGNDFLHMTPKTQATKEKVDK